VKVLGIDPGVTNGYAVVSDVMGDRQYVETCGWTQSPSVLGEVIELKKYILRDFWVVVEDFVGAGPRNADNKRTIETLGFVRHLCALRNIECKVRQPQTRLAYVERADFLVPRERVHGEQEAWNQHRVHIVQAAAHALSWMNHLEGK